MHCPEQFSSFCARARKTWEKEQRRQLSVHALKLFGLSVSARLGTVWLPRKVASVGFRFRKPCKLLCSHWAAQVPDEMLLLVACCAARVSPCSKEDCWAKVRQPWKRRRQYMQIAVGEFSRLAGKSKHYSWHFHFWLMMNGIGRCSAGHQMGAVQSNKQSRNSLGFVKPTLTTALTKSLVHPSDVPTLTLKQLCHLRIEVVQPVRLLMAGKWGVEGL